MTCIDRCTVPMGGALARHLSVSTIIKVDVAVLISFSSSKVKVTHFIVHHQSQNVQTSRRATRSGGSNPLQRFGKGQSRLGYSRDYSLLTTNSASEIIMVVVCLWEGFFFLAVHQTFQRQKGFRYRNVQVGIEEMTRRININSKMFLNVNYIVCISFRYTFLQPTMCTI